MCWDFAHLPPSYVWPPLLQRTVLLACGVPKLYATHIGLLDRLDTLAVAELAHLKRIQGVEHY